MSGYAQDGGRGEGPAVALDDDGVFDVEGDQPGKPLGVRGMDKTDVPDAARTGLADTLAHGVFISLPESRRTGTACSRCP